MERESKKIEAITEEDYDVEGYSYCTSKMEKCLTDCWPKHNAVFSPND